MMTGGHDRQHGLLEKLKPEHWANAKAFFADPQNEGKVKYRRKVSNEPYSFIKVSGEIFAIENHQYLGEGGYGKVKICQNEQGENFAVKIEGKKLQEEEDAETKILYLLGQMIGRAGRIREGKEKNPLNNGYGLPTKHRSYTVTELIEGTTLFKGLKSVVAGHDQKFKNHKVALKIAKVLQVLHEKRILHRDLTTKNIMVNAKNDVITVTPIDFGLSVVLGENEEFVTDPKRPGTGYTQPPEVGKYGIYSFASDIFALGVMLTDDLNISDPLIMRMKAENPADRPSLEEVIDYLSLSAELSPEVINLVETGDLNTLEQALEEWRPVQTDANKFTLLHFAARGACGQNAAAVLELILNTGKVNSEHLAMEEEGFEGDNPLHIAVRYNQIALVEILLQHGCDLTTPNINDDTPLEIAEDCGHTEMTAFIERKLSELQRTKRAEPLTPLRASGSAAMNDATDKAEAEPIEPEIKANTRTTEPTKETSRKKQGGSSVR